MVAPFLKQAWTSSGVHMNMIGGGMMLGYTSSLLPALRAPDSTIKVDLNTTSWISSSVGAAAIPGFITSSYLMYRWGRRLTSLVVLLPAIIGWLFIYFASNVPLLLTGRILTGFTGGATVALGSVSIGEYSSPQNRGTFLNFKTASVCIGSALVHALGHFYDWRTLALMAVIPTVISFAIVCTWVESPAWLASKKRFEESRKAFIWLRGDNEQSRKELDEMIRIQKEQSEIVPSRGSVVQFLKKFTRKDFIKPLYIITVSFVLLEFSGRHIFPAYAAEIILSLIEDKSQAFYYTLGIDLVIAGSATFSSVVVKVVKRRFILFSTGFASVMVLAGLCIYLYLTSQEIVSSDRPWIPISLLVIYFILANQGCTIIPIALLGEIFPLEHRSAGSSVSGILLSVCVNVGLLVTPYLMVSVKVYGTFAVFGGISMLCLVILYFTLPETKDRTLQEIENYFKYGKFELDKYDEESREKMFMELNTIKT